MTIEFKKVYSWRTIDLKTGLLSEVPDQYNGETGEYIHVDDEYDSEEEAYYALGLLITEETKWRYTGDNLKLIESVKATW